MFDFSSWRVRTRLTVGFGVVCVLLVASVVMGLMAMGRIGTNLQSVVSDHLPRIVASANVLTQTDAIAIALRNMMLNADAADRERQTQVIAQSRQEVVRLFDTLDKTLTEPKDLPVYGEFTATVPSAPGVQRPEIKLCPCTASGIFVCIVILQVRKMRKENASISIFRREEF